MGPGAQEQRRGQDDGHTGKDGQVQDRRGLGENVQREGAAIPLDQVRDRIDRQDPALA